MKLQAKRTRNECFIAFAGNLTIALAILLPYIIAGDGFFTLSEDFNAQTIPIYYMIHNAVRSGELFWNWSIDIGSEFWSSMGTPVGNWLSPFMWFIPFVPESWLPCMTWIVLLLKYAVAGTTSFLFIRRYSESFFGAFAGAVLYAFSGAFAINIVFNMLDGAILFPLLLWSMDLLIQENRRGLFAVAVFLNVCASVSLFVASFCGMVIYFLIRYWSWDKSLFKKIGVCVLEGAIGILLAGFVFFPQVNVLLQDKRTSVTITGDSALSYSSFDLIMLIRGILFPADAMSNGSWIVSNDWWSNSIYIPMTGILLVTVFVNRNRKHWISRIIIICAVMAFIPILNNLFMLGRAGGYRRWFYFPLLVMCLASAKMLDLPEQYKIGKNTVFFVVFIIVFSLFAVKFPWTSQGDTLPILDKTRFSHVFTYTVLGLIAAWCIWRFAKKENVCMYMLIGIVLFSIVTNRYTINSYQLPSAHSAGEGNSTVEVSNKLFNTPKILEDSGILPYRITHWDSYWNHGLMHQWPTCTSFASVVDSGINRFYDALGTPRSSAMTPWRPGGTDALLSVKYFILDYENQSYDLLNSIHNGNRQLYLYEDVNALPIGFTYDTYLTRSEFDQIDPELKSVAMLKTLVIADEDEPVISNALRKYSPELDGDFSVDNILQYQLEHMGESSIDFETDKSGFSTTIISNGMKYAFFSVPNNANWSATVNDKEVNIYEINGLTAVPVEEGTNRIIFTYTPRIVYWSCTISAAAMAMFVFLYLPVASKRKNAKTDMKQQ